ncbi:DUF975 family protein [Bifidobacterium pseudocatenulatum]|uniref:DUF975 family protein n=1 Tax=Bifidobacterium pseudocatenulatum TaxID=28026 RepID=UPI001D0142ED|nr:DUF975 family protein [Bifidobacterium pseudocatenulatum]UDG87673.1 DUF975 family protein [Bifidobacterium pseudocatenulatum]
MDRKGMKVAAKKAQRKHYWMIVAICLFASVFGVAYTSSTLSVSTNISISTPQTEDSTQSNDMYDVLQDLAVGNENDAREKVKQNQEQIVNNDTDATFGRRRGVIASLLNSFASGSMVIAVADAINSVTHNGGVSIAVPVILSLAVYIFVWLFIQETYRIVMARMLLEGRSYNKLPASRFFYPIHTRKWPRMAWTMFVENVFLFLWSLTIVGFFIKQYSYRMVPYIVAENPNIEALDAIRLSRRMMKGHKWECFVADCSFLGWYLLNLITFGLSGIFYSNGYNAAFFAEYYVYVRSMAKTTGIAGSEMLNDEYLYFKADPQTLHTTYADVAQSVAQLEQNLVPAPKPHGFTGFLSEWLGIRILHASAVNRYEEYREDLHQMQIGENILNGSIYPGRLAPAPMPFKFRESRTISADRSYSLNLIMMFFIFCFVGWVWEVSLAFISEDMFVNRGTLHGPWLPIYGTGGVIILVLLKKLREKPALEFVAAMVLCGCLEYFSSWYLEMTHDGQRWWDYTGYFLNINGRICAEGLLTFGLGGLTIVYLLAPALDNLLSRIDARKLGIVAAVLLVLYCADQVYSAQHPNVGAGITDYKGSDTSLEAPTPYEIRKRSDGLS